MRHLTASMVVLDQSAGTVLLVKHNAIQKWVFPGGHVDENEAPHEAAVREVLEEAGITARIVHPDPIPLASAVWYPSPWITAEFDAPVKPHKGEPAHKHVDFLYLGVPASALATGFRFPADEVSGVQWTAVELLHRRDDVRAEVPLVAAAALNRLRWHRW